MSELYVVAHYHDQPPVATDYSRCPFRLHIHTAGRDGMGGSAQRQASWAACEGGTDF